MIADAVANNTIYDVDFNVFIRENLVRIITISNLVKMFRLLFTILFFVLRFQV